MPKPILSGCCASAAPVSASPMNKAPSARLEVLRTLLPGMVPPLFSLSGDYESALLFVKRYQITGGYAPLRSPNSEAAEKHFPLPQALAALERGEHLDLEFPRPEAESLACLLVEERPIRLEAHFTHPCEQRLPPGAARPNQGGGGA